MIARVTHRWPFQIASVLILILALDVVWWAAILVTFLAGCAFTTETTDAHRR